MTDAFIVGPEPDLTHNSENLNLSSIQRAANLEQFWSCLQRYLSFDSPDSRWAKVLALLVKHSKNEKRKHFLEAPLTEQEEFFNECFGPLDTASLKQARVFNTFLALQDFENFEPSAFDTWYLSLPPDFCADRNLSEEDAAFLSSLSELLQLTASQQAWLEHCWRACPDWTILSNSGPWQNDTLAAFVRKTMSYSAPLADIHKLEDFIACQEKLKALLVQSRSKLPAQFQPEMLILVEGATEAILLPHFAGLLKLDFNTTGILVNACGGSNQLERKYLMLRDICKIPIMIILDSDAKDTIATINDILRDQDRLFIWKAGEIEDTFSKPILVDLLNAYLQSLSSTHFISMSDFDSPQRRTLLLDRLWKTRGLGNFNKVGFAEFLKKYLRTASSLPEPIQELIGILKSLKTSKAGDRNTKAN